MHNSIGPSHTTPDSATGNNSETFCTFKDIFAILLIILQCVAAEAVIIIWPRRTVRGLKLHIVHKRDISVQLISAVGLSFSKR